MSKDELTYIVEPEGGPVARKVNSSHTVSSEELKKFYSYLRGLAEGGPLMEHPLPFATQTEVELEVEKLMEIQFGSPYKPKPFIQFNPKEVNMALEKRAVVNTPKEKKAHKKVKAEKTKPAKEKK